MESTREGQASPSSAPGAAPRVGRFAVTAEIASSGGCQFLRAQDAAGQAVELVALPDGAGPSSDALGASILSMKGHGIDGLGEPIAVEVGAGRTLLVCGEVPGGALSAVLARKQSTGSAGFAPRAAASLVARLCAIATALHERGGVHGAISSASVRIDKAGGVHLSGLGLASAAASLAATHPTPFTAPELANGSAANAASDMFAIGAVLYQVLVGTEPVRGCARPSEVIAGLPAQVDQVIAACMHPRVERRPPNADALKQALVTALAAQANSAPQANSETGNGNEGPRRAARPSLAEALTDDPASGQVRNSGQIATAIAADEEAWLVNKDGLDYGPFSMAAVFEMIRTSEILPGHSITNKHTGERAPVEEHPLLVELVEEAKAARDERRRADAEVASSKTEKRRGFALYAFIAAAVLGLAGGAYLIVTKLSADGEKKQAELGALEEGELQATISFPTRQGKSGKRGKRTGKSKSGKKSSGGSQNEGGWDDAVDFGDASKGGGDERLDDSQINPVVQRGAGRLGGCLRKNGGGTAAIKFIIKGTGKISYVAVNGQTKTPLAKCIGSVMRGLKFPSFDGARTRANFTMSF